MHPLDLGRSPFLQPDDFTTSSFQTTHQIVACPSSVLFACEDSTYAYPVPCSAHRIILQSGLRGCIKGQTGFGFSEVAFSLKTSKLYTKLSDTPVF